jgi:nucleotide-binding universal stress UspA family protein
VYRALCVPLDGSPQSEQALPLALALAKASGAQLRLLHVHTPTDSIYVPGLPVIDGQLRSLGRLHEHTYLTRLAARIAAEAPLAVFVDNPDSSGSVAGTIMQSSSAHDCAMLVLTTHGRGGWERAWLGSVADTLVRLSPVPVLLVRGSDGAPPPAHGLPQRVLVPLDGSPEAASILPHALALGRVVAPAKPASELLVPPDTDDAARVARECASARAYLDAVARQLRAEGLDVEIEVRVDGHVASAILAVAQATSADCIAMTTHARSGVSRLLLGSVADKVLRGATLPVLMLHPPTEQHEAAVARAV